MTQTEAPQAKRRYAMTRPTAESGQIIDAPKPPWAYDTTGYYATRSRSRARVVYKEPLGRFALLRRACAPHAFRLYVLAVPFIFGLGLLIGASLR